MHVRRVLGDQVEGAFIFDVDHLHASNRGQERRQLLRIRWD